MHEEQLTLLSPRQAWLSCKPAARRLLVMGTLEAESTRAYKGQRVSRFYGCLSLFILLQRVVGAWSSWRLTQGTGDLVGEARNQTCQGAWCWPVLWGLFLQHTGRISECLCCPCPVEFLSLQPSFSLTGPFRFWVFYQLTNKSVWPWSPE